MRIRKYVLLNYSLVMASVLMFIGLSFFLKLSLFGEELEMDGFFSQVTAIVDGRGEGQLQYVHFFRLIAVYPFFYIYISDLPNFLNGIVLSFMLFPILSYKAGSRDFNPLQLLIVLLPFFFSIRVTLGACSISYLYLFLFGGKKNFVLFILSIIFSLLSSGTILCLVLILFAYRKTFSKQYPLLFKLMGVMVIAGLALAMVNKYQGVAAGDSGYSESGAQYTGIMAVWGLFTRGTLVVSIEVGNYPRAIAYAIFYAAGIGFILLVAGKGQLRKRYMPFFIPFVFIFWFEGMGFISYIYSIILFMIYHTRLGSDSPSNSEARLAQIKPEKS